MDPWKDVALSLDPTTRDRHAYAMSNPVSYVDINGHDACPDGKSMNCHYDSDNKCHGAGCGGSGSTTGTGGTRNSGGGGSGDGAGGGGGSTGGGSPSPSDGSCGMMCGGTTASITAITAMTASQLSAKKSFNIFSALKDADDPFYYGMSHDEILLDQGDELIRASKYRTAGRVLRAAGPVGTTVGAGQDVYEACHDGTTGPVGCKTRGAARATVNWTATAGMTGTGVAACGGPANPFAYGCGAMLGIPTAIYGPEVTNEVVDDALNNTATAPKRTRESTAARICHYAGVPQEFC